MTVGAARVRWVGVGAAPNSAATPAKLAGVIPLAPWRKAEMPFSPAAWHAYAAVRIAGPSTIGSKGRV